MPVPWTPSMEVELSVHGGKMKPSRVDPDAHIWATLLKHMRAHKPDICRQWFDQLEPLGVAGGVLRVRAHSLIHRDYLQRACSGPFNDAAQTATGRLISVRFLGPDEPVEPSPKPAATPKPEPKPAPSTDPPHTVHRPSTPAPTAELTPVENVREAPREFVPGPAPNASISPETLEHLYDDGLVLNPDYAFDGFVVGPGNRLAHAAALAVASNPGRHYNPFFVHGGVGLGKTHLLQAICLAIRAQRPDAVIYYTSCEGFMTQFMDAVAAGAMHLFRHKFRHVDVLVIDDIHFLAKRDRTQEEFFHTFNSLFQNGKQIVLSSDAPPHEIPDLEDRLVSRFKSGLVAEVSPPDFETRVQILKNKARLRGFELTEPVAQRIAQRIDTNIRELEGAVIKLQMMATVDKREIDLDLVKAALGEAQPTEEPTVQIPTIIEAVADFFGVKMVDMQSKRRQRSVALPRQLCMYLARRNTRFSLEEIGGYFGGRDHTTVMHAVKIVQQRCTTDAEFGQQVQSLESRLRGGRG
ncbi:MAG TPA: chromosomal replication initiator protein DnaA [Phycisphaerales bacterium]|nr:chromosomal replication initiator protein DnaA [Phycisphaerales bacterium]